jgi:CheY-like chemotaxis protein
MSLDSESTHAARVLIVDDDASATRSLRRLLEAAECVVEEENDSARASLHTREFKPDFVILDFKMPGLHGGDLAWQLQSDPEMKRIKLIVYSDLPECEIRSHLPPDPIPVLEKPIDIDALLRLLREADRDKGPLP